MSDEIKTSMGFGSLPQAVEALCVKVFGAKPMYLAGMWDGFPTPTEETLRESLEAERRESFRLRCNMMVIAEILGINGPATLDHHIIDEVKRVTGRLKRLSNAADTLWEEHKEYSLELHGQEGCDRHGSDSEGHSMMEELVRESIASAKSCQNRCQNSPGNSPKPIADSQDPIHIDNYTGPDNMQDLSDDRTRPPEDDFDK